MIPELFFWLVFSHCLADYPLQGDFLARAKVKDGIPAVPWQVALFAHSMIHAGFVAYWTGSLLLGVLELIAHMAIDHAKGRGWFKDQSVWFHPIDTAEVVLVQERRAFWIDQTLHILCKVLWIWLAFYA